MAHNKLIPSEALLGKETKEYLKAHPEVAEYLQRMARAQELFGRIIRLTGSHRIVRDLASGSTSEVELNGTLSRTNN